MTEKQPESTQSGVLSRTWILNGLNIEARFEMPDMLKFADGSFDIPNEAQADIFELIYGDNFSVSELAQLQGNRRKLRGLYALMSIVMVDPVLCLDDDDRQPGQLAPRQITWTDLTSAYAFFRYGPPDVLPLAQSEESRPGETPPHAE